MVSGAALAAEMDRKRAAEKLRFAKLEVMSTTNALFMF